MIKELPQCAKNIFLKILNRMLSIGYFPKLWKISKIIMIEKPGKDPTIASSYRPISLLPTLSKVFEKLLIKKLQCIIEERNIIPQHQFGFRKKHSTVEQIHRIVETVNHAFEARKY